MKDFNLSKPETEWLDSALDRLGLNLVGVQALKVEASHRTFYRLETSSSTLILMLSPPALEANDRFVNLSDAFSKHGVPVPEVIAAETQLGCFLLNDLGKVHLQDTYNTSLESEALQAAIDQLGSIAATQHPDIEPYTKARLETEIEIFAEWFQAAFLKQPSGGWITNYGGLIDSIDMQPKCCVHRDYHCRNLLYNDSRLGVVDFQDALCGPILYDIASLLRDCYQVFDETTIKAGLKSFLALPHTDRLKANHSFDEVLQLFDYTAIQRQIKAIGIFARLSIRDGKDSHLAHIRPNLVRVIALTAKYSELGKLNMQLNSCFTRYDDQTP